MSGDSWKSTLYEPFENARFRYLPSKENPGNGFVWVATLHFETDEPRQTMRDKNEDARHQANHPGEYLQTHHKRVLEDLFLPIDNGYEGDATRRFDDAPDDYSGPTLNDACQYLSGMVWKFVAYADPRETSSYNRVLSRDRARVAASYMMEQIWNNGQIGSSDSNHEEAMDALLDWWYGNSGQSWKAAMQQWTNDHYDSVIKWRAKTWWNIWAYKERHSVMKGDQGRDPADLNQEFWPWQRRVEIWVQFPSWTNTRSWDKECSDLQWLADEDYVPDDEEEYVAVVNPDKLMDFNKNNQFEGDWDPGTDPGSVNPKDGGGVLLWLMDQISRKEEAYERDDKTWSDFATDIDALIYEYRFFRLLQHEFLQGNAPPGRGKGPGFMNPGTNLAAHELTCEGVSTGYDGRYRKLIQQSNLGEMIFGGNMNDSGIKQARQIAHQYHVRIDPWYRVAYLEEIPGSQDAGGPSWWPNTDGRNIEDLSHWPDFKIDDVSDLHSSIREHLDPVGEGKKSEDEAPDGKNWATGIPKALRKKADYPDPEGFMNGEKHYKWLANHGSYTYDDLSYLDDENSTLTDSAKSRLTVAYTEKNGGAGETLRSHLEKVRYAVRQAMVIVEAQLSDDNWEKWLDERRKPYPDYTDDSVWQEWKEPMPSPIMGPS